MTRANYASSLQPGQRVLELLLKSRQNPEEGRFVRAEHLSSEDISCSARAGTLKASPGHPYGLSSVCMLDELQPHPFKAYNFIEPCSC